MNPTRQAGLNVMVVSFGGPGDVLPLAAIGAALARRGHRVTLISNPHFESDARRMGLEFEGFGSAGRLASAMHGGGHERSSGGWVRRGLDRWRRRSRGPLGSMRWLYGYIEGSNIAGQTVLVARGNAYGARLAQERLGIPLATVHLQPAAIHSEYDAPGLPVPGGSGRLPRLCRRLAWKAIDGWADHLLAPEMNEFRRELGLSPARRISSAWSHSPELVLGMFPDWFARPQPDWPSATRLVGFPLFDGSGLRDTPAELEPFLAGGTPPVVFTTGSFHPNGGPFFQTALGICRRLGVRGVLLCPAAGCVPANLPQGVLHLPYAPLSAVLGKAAALVHHGGIGTTGLALAAGVPQLVAPFNDDQFDNARRVERLGAGVRLNRPGFHVDEAARMLRALLHSSGRTGACRALAARMQGADACVEAACHIERLVPSGHGWQ
ncbi:MAG: glycosyltransferase family 1 protein [Candidatus Solibacter usitatus]|nr:glycosyltransferase family 1 protein [Candidatus Solibacter usitatus]